MHSPVIYSPQGRELYLDVEFVYEQVLLLSIAKQRLPRLMMYIIKTKTVDTEALLLKAANALASVRDDPIIPVKNPSIGFNNIANGGIDNTIINAVGFTVALLLYHI
jgi:uncharacterized protein YbbK (DUF523 family)